MVNRFTQEQIDNMAPGEVMFYNRVGWDTKQEDVSMSYKYDVFYNNKTGELLESICNCEPGTCTFTDAWIADGKPTQVDLSKLSDHNFDGEVIEFN